jgi:hypothetical protein
MTIGPRLLALLMMTLVIGGCGMFGSRSGSDNPYDEPENPLTDEQTMAQVIDPAKEIVHAVTLHDVTGGFSYGSCNDQGDPPFQGRVEVAFKLPPGDPGEVYQQVTDAMVRLGWNTGAPAGQKVYGVGLNRDGVMATVGPRAIDPGYGSLQLYGECRNMGEHGNDDAVSITDQLRQR